MNETRSSGERYYTALIFYAAAEQTRDKLKKACRKVNFVGNFCVFLEERNLEINQKSIGIFDKIVKESKAQSLEDCKKIGSAFKQFKHSLRSDITPDRIGDLFSADSSLKFAVKCSAGSSKEFLRYSKLFDRFVNSIYKPRTREQDSFSQVGTHNKRKEILESQNQSTEVSSQSRKRRRRAVNEEPEDIVDEPEIQAAEDIEKEKEVENSYQNFWLDPTKLDLVADLKTPHPINKIVSRSGQALFSSPTGRSIYCWDSTANDPKRSNVATLTFKDDIFNKIIDFDVSPRFASVVIDPTNPLVFSKTTKVYSLKNWQLMKLPQSFNSSITKVKIFGSYIAFGFDNGNLNVTDLERNEEKYSFKRCSCDYYFTNQKSSKDTAFPLNSRVLSIDMSKELIAASGSSKESAVAKMDEASVSVFRGYRTMVKVNVLFEDKLFTSSKHEVLIWDLNNFKNVYNRTFELNDREIQSIIPDQYGYYRLLTKSNAVEYFDLRAHGTTPYHRISFSETGGQIASISKDDNDLYIGFENGYLFKTSGKMPVTLE